MPNLIKSSRSLALTAGLGLAVALGSCASNYGAGDTPASSVGQTATVREGFVVSVRAVKIQPDQNYLGAGVGAVLGGLAGSQIGGGREENAAGAIAGAVAGGVIGNQVSKAGNTRDGFAYVIDFGGGKIQEVTQGADVYIQPGTPVYVSFGTDRVRVWPK